MVLDSFKKHLIVFVLTSDFWSEFALCRHHLALRTVHIDSDSNLGLHLLAWFNQFSSFSCWIGGSQLNWIVNVGRLIADCRKNKEYLGYAAWMTHHSIRKSNPLKKPLSLVVLLPGCTQIYLQPEVPTFNYVDT